MNHSANPSIHPGPHFTLKVSFSPNENISISSPQSRIPFLQASFYFFSQLLNCRLWLNTTCLRHCRWHRVHLVCMQCSYLSTRCNLDELTMQLSHLRSLPVQEPLSRSSGGEYHKVRDSPGRKNYSRESEN